MFVTPMKERIDGLVEIKDFDANILRLVVKWIYTGDIGSIQFPTQVELFKAAHKYEIESLKNWCVLQICKNMLAENSIEMYEFGKTYEDNNITDQALKIMKS
jgi:speckle-type POZ protein